MNEEQPHKDNDSGFKNWERVGAVALTIILATVANQFGDGCYKLAQRGYNYLSGQSQTSSSRPDTSKKNQDTATFSIDTLADDSLLGSAYANGSLRLIDIYGKKLDWDRKTIRSSQNELNKDNAYLKAKWNYLDSTRELDKETWKFIEDIKSLDSGKISFDEFDKRHPYK